MDEHRLIGVGNRMPWHLPADLKRFRHLTLGKPVLMGRRTHESIGGALPGRHNIVLSRRLHYKAPDCTVVSTLEEGLQASGAVEEIMIIGGASLYQQTLTQAQRIYLTQIQGTFQGDTWFPERDLNEWEEVWYEDSDSQAPGAYRFSILERVKRETGF